MAPEPIIIESVAVTLHLDPYLTLPALAAYSGLGVRSLRRLINDVVRPLPYYRIGAKYVVRRSDYDAWVLQYRRNPGWDLHQVAVAAVAEITERHPSWE